MIDYSRCLFWGHEPTIFQPGPLLPIKLFLDLSHVILVDGSLSRTINESFLVIPSLTYSQGLFPYNYHTPVLPSNSRTFTSADGTHFNWLILDKFNKGTIYTGVNSVVGISGGRVQVQTSPIDLSHFFQLLRLKWEERKSLTWQR